MADDFTAPSPGFDHAFDAIIEREAPVTVGSIATGGRRIYRPIKGGSIEGSGFSGTFVGGGETLLERADGVIDVEASYYIAFANGAAARCFGKGYITRGDRFSGLRLALLFEAAEDGPAAELATRAFMAEQAQGSRLMQIARIT